MRKKLLLVFLTLMLALCALGLAACANKPESNGTKVPLKTDGKTEREVDLFDRSTLLALEGRAEYKITDYVNENGAEDISYRLDAGEGVNEQSFSAIKNGKFTVTVHTVGDKTFALCVRQREQDVFTVNFKIHVISTEKYQMNNGGFETGDLTGWTASGDFNGIKMPYAALNNQTFFDDQYQPVPLVSQDGEYYLDGFAQNSGFVGQDWQGTLTSPGFTVGGSRYVTFMLGGGNQDSLSLELHSKTQNDAGTELIACFNNWKYADPYRALGLTRYSYQIPEQYADRECFFVLRDASSLPEEFPAFVADSFISYYPVGEEPVADNRTIFAAGKFGELYANTLNAANADKQLKNGGFETGDLTGWFTACDHEKAYQVSDADTYFDEIYPDQVPNYNKQGEYFLTSLAQEGYTGSIYSSAFRASGKGWITFRMGGSNDGMMKVKLMQHNSNGADVKIAEFNNWNFQDPYRSWGMTKYAYQIPEEFIGSALYFVLQDGRTSNFGALTADDFVTYYKDDEIPVIDEETIYPAGYVTVPVYGFDLKLGLDTAQNAIRNGGFETGDMTGWFVLQGTADGYAVSDADTYFGFLPVAPSFNKDGMYFLNGTGAEAGLEAFTGDICSQAFVANGTGWITFRMGGNNSDLLQLKLMRYVDGKSDQEIAVFNNYLFADPFRGYAMTNYGYHIPSEYIGDKFYFVVSDRATSMFGGISLDSVRTDYEIAPEIFTGEAPADGALDALNVYPAGFKTAPVGNISSRPGPDDAANSIRNGGFETGDMTGCLQAPATERFWRIG